MIDLVVSIATAEVRICILIQQNLDLDHKLTPHMPGTAPSLYSSPLQGYTDFRFRSAFHRYFGGIDVYMAPYIQLDARGEIRASRERDVLPSNNEGMSLVPQLMAGDAGDFLHLVSLLQQLGYKEVNWNLGCPYPMVAKRGMGSGLLVFPGKIHEILETVFSETDIRVSVKLRLGYENPEEIFAVLPVLDRHPLEYVAIHPRIGRQLYKGKVDLEAFKKCLDQTGHRIAYNGDIRSVEDFHEMQDRFPRVRDWMIGRGLIADPFLPAMIKAGTISRPEGWASTFRDFHDTLLSFYSEALSGDKHLLLKMYSFWEYFINLFPDDQKGLKKIKKARTLEAYRSQVNQILIRAR